MWGRWMCPLFYGRGTPCLSRGAPRSAYPLPMTSADTSARFVEAVEKANVGLFTELNGKKTVPSAWDPPPSGSLRVRRHPARNVPSPPGGRVPTGVVGGRVVGGIGRGMWLRR